MKRNIIAIAALIAFGAQAQQTQQLGDNSTGAMQNIGDVDNSKASSTSTQINPSANSNGNDLSTNTDVRTQINPTITPTTTSNATGNLSNNDNKSNATAINGPQTMGAIVAGQANVGPTSSYSGGNILGGANAATGAIDNKSAGGAGGAGGAASSTGTNLGINGQQQGIDKSGNSDVRNTNALGQATDVRNANGQGQGQKQSNAQGQGQTASTSGTNAQGQSSENKVNTGGNTQATSAGNGAGANNRTANTTRVDASDRSLTTNMYTSKAVAWAPIIPGPVAAPVAAANLVIIPGECGPRVRLVATNVTGKQFGPFGGQYDVLQGQDTDTTMAQGADGQYEPYIVIGDKVWGHRVDRAVGALGTSSATNFSIGGFTSKGDAAQGGAGGSGSLQQIVARSFVTDCVIGKVIKPAPVVIVDQSVIHRPSRQDRN